MVGRNALASSILAAALLAGAPGAASAQCRLCSTPTTQLEKTEDGGPIRLEVATSLDFDRIVLLGAGSGAATLLPSGARSATGSIITVSAGAMVGSVTVRGEPGRAVRVEIPARVTLYSLSGGQIVIDEIETDLPSAASERQAGRRQELNVQATVSEDEAVVRLGTIHIEPAPQIASSQ